MKRKLLFLGCLLVITTILLGCGQFKKASKKVVIYVCLDPPFSEPILEEFEESTGIKVKPVFDVEATKTTGLVNRLIAEKNNPQTDVFWNNEIAQTIVLKEKGIFSPYISPSAKDIPEQFKDPQGYWTGFAARARVIIYNKNLVNQDEIPKSIFDLTKPKWKGQCTIAKPLFGTTFTHAAALFSYLGDEEAKRYFEKLNQNEVVIVNGNSIVKRSVANGELKFGLTDTDDANVAIQAGKPVDIVFPDQKTFGTLLIPNTVSLVKNAPHPKLAKKLIDYLLSPEVEKSLAHSGSAQMPVRGYVKTPPYVSDIDDIKTMPVDFQEVADKMEEVAKYLQESFIK